MFSVLVILRNLILPLTTVFYATALANSLLVSNFMPRSSYRPLISTSQSLTSLTFYSQIAEQPIITQPFPTLAAPSVLGARSYIGDNPDGETFPTVFFDMETYYHFSSLGFRKSTLVPYTTDTYIFESSDRYDFTGQSYPTTAVYSFSISANCATLIGESETTTSFVSVTVSASLSGSKSSTREPRTESLTSTALVFTGTVPRKITSSESLYSLSLGPIVGPLLASNTGYFCY